MVLLIQPALPSCVCSWVLFLVASVELRTWIHDSSIKKTDQISTYADQICYLVIVVVCVSLQADSYYSLL